jgi:DNA helicase HerA-like ATPase
MNPTRRPIGRVVRGSLSKGLEVHLAEEQCIEALRAGQFIVARGQQNEFFGMITDLGLASVNNDPLEAPGSADPSLARLLQGTALYGTATVRPSLMSPLAAPAGRRPEPQPAKTLPRHFSPVFHADAGDVARIFGEEKPGDFRHFAIGSPLEMNGIPLCVQVERLVERSTGIFGKSGTGKTFLTRLVLASLIRNAAEDAPVALVFDMHNEYGGEALAEGEAGRQRVIGLKQLFGGARVEVFAVSRRDARPVDFDVRIPYSQVEPGDILLLHEELRLHRTAAESAYLAERHFGKGWFAALLANGAEQLAEETEGNRASLGALSRKLQVLAHHCRGFLCPDDQLPAGPETVDRILGNLQSGKHTIVEFGTCRMPVQYMLVANILSRRLHARYVEMTEAWQTGRSTPPRPLVIAIEEAHKFLSPGLAEQTIFGTIAREMRKYSVTLLVIDQRPSGIDAEVLSQLGTKFACLLDNDRDLEAVLSGVSSSSGLRGVLASLATKKQALIVGHAVPMPVVVDTREYGDETFLRAMGYQPPAARTAGAKKEVEAIFG